MGPHENGDCIMTAYTDSMVAELTKTGSFDYDSAAAYAEKHNLSIRSVISKVKSLGLEYTKREVVKSVSGAKVRKSDLVASLAIKIDADPDALAGLAKADMASLKALIKAVA